LKTVESISDAFAEKWHETADVVIIGSGFAGLAAAIEAGNAGASVIILEKMKGRGGNSVISDGLVAAAGSILQMEQGIEDTPQDMFNDMLRAGLGLNHPDLVQLLVEKSAETLRIGAAPVHLSWIQLGPWTSPDERMYGFGPLFASYIAMPYGIMVDPASGKRFVNELADRKIRADAILNLGKPCIGIADARGVQASGQNIDKCLKRKVVKGFEDLTQLARNYGIPEKALQQTVKEYNTYVLQKQDNAFEKPILEGAKPLRMPPFYGIRMWPKVHHTMGGIRINTHAQVINLDGNPVEGLFAAGEVTGGVHGACRLGSCAITDCLVFGRIAGKNAAILPTR
jgi:succinate dehydrogenase/fumarate reductase flavoprotein subunit